MRTVGISLQCECLASEAIQGTTLTFQGVDHIHSGDSLPLGVFAVGDCVTDDILKEELEHTTDLFVNQSRDTLDTTTASQAPDSGLGDALDVIAENFAMTLGATLSQAFAALATSRHDV
jgi:hypothetical protein